jgi:hypothetical protein
MEDNHGILAKANIFLARCQLENSKKPQHVNVIETLTMLELCRWSQEVNDLNKEQGARKEAEKKSSEMVMEATGDIHIYIETLSLS